MKKFFEKHSLGKSLLIMFLISIVLTWIIPSASFSGTEYAETELVRIGLSDIGNIFYYMFAMSVDKILFILTLGVFYGVLSKIKAYNTLISRIANKIKGKEILFTVLTSVFVAVLTSLSTSTFAVLIFVPFIIAIIDELGLSKLTAFIVTFGSMLIGSLGAIFGSDGFRYLNYYISYNSSFDFLKIDVFYRVLVLVISLLLFNFFTVLHVAKETDKVLFVKKEKKSKEKADKKSAKKNTSAEKKNDKVVITKPEGKLSIGLIIVLSLVAIISILGMIDWNGYFGIEAFNKFHDSIVNLTIGKDFKLIYYILGTSVAPLGNQGSDYQAFNLYSMMSLVIIASVILIVAFVFNFEEVSKGVKEGLKKAGLVAIGLMLSYSVYIVFYFSPMMVYITNKVMPVEGTPDINIDYKGSGIAFFNLDEDNDNKADTNLINKDTNKDGKCDINCDIDGDGYPDEYLDFDGDGEISSSDEEILETFTSTSILNYDTNQDGYPDVNIDTDYNLASNIVAAFITSIFHSEIIYTSYLLSSYLVSGFGGYMNIVFIIYLTMAGLVAFLAPNSVLLVTGLTYTEVDYKKWLKYIWKFAVGMLACLLLIYILLFIL